MVVHYSRYARFRIQISTHGNLSERGDRRWDRRVILLTWMREDGIGARHGTPPVLLLDSPPGSTGPLVKDKGMVN
nr:unnamed protein product [Digitaria exilis]